MKSRELVKVNGNIWMIVHIVIKEVLVVPKHMKVDKSLGMIKYIQRYCGKLEEL